MPRSAPSIVIVGGCALLATALLVTFDMSTLDSLLLIGNRSAEEPQSGKLDGREPASLERARTLFDRGEWARARKQFDAVRATNEDWYSPPARQAVESALLCSLQMRDPEDALRRALIADSQLKERNYAHSYWRRQREVLDKADIAYLEFARRLYCEIASQTPATAEPGFRTRLAAAHIALDSRLLAILDPDRVLPGKLAQGYRYSNMDWWWEGVPEAEAYFDKTSVWDSSYWERGIPLAPDGSPVFPVAPRELHSQQGRSLKILFLLKEIQQLDQSPEKRDAAQALMHRADLARRLYGPSADPDWNSGRFYYQYAGRPSFLENTADPDLKEFWELEDQQARAIVGQQLGIIELPDSENPLSLWRRVQQQYPQSDLVAEGIYQRGLYFQNRRQFTKAIHEYRESLARFPEHERAEHARKQIANIQDADVLLGKTGVYPSGSTPKLWFACRNARQVEFTAREVDLHRFYKERTEGKKYWGGFGYDIGPFRAYTRNDHLQDYVGLVASRWTQAVSASDRVATHETKLPRLPLGGYVVEARVAGSQRVSRAVVVLTDATIVHKALADKVLLWVVDARSGRPLQDRKIEIVSFKRKQSAGSDTRTTETRSSDENGVVEYVPQEDSNQYAVLRTGNGGLSYANVGAPGFYGSDQVERCVYGVTDRPLYRPGSTVHFRIWSRELVNRKYRPALAGESLRIAVHGPNNEDTLQPLKLSTDETGSASGSFQLHKEAALGEYHLEIQRDQEDYFPRTCRFRVEEYKKPEFEVSVTPAQDTARLGAVIAATVEARYYFDAPVAGARVHYRVHRQSFRARYALPTPWDWLYDDQSDSQHFSHNYFGMRDDWYSPRRQPAWHGDGRSELIDHGVVHLDKNGTADISIDSQAFAKDRDHRITIEVEVRDESRRTISGMGTVLVTRQQFQAFTELDRGWYTTGSRATVTVNTRTPNQIPVSAAGTLTLSRISSENSGVTESAEQTVNSWPAQTDTNGYLAFEFELAQAGRYLLKFATQDAEGQPVSSATHIWVHGPQSDGRLYQFRDLQIIPERRWYQAGDTARLLVITPQPDARLMLCDNNGQHRFLEIPAHSGVIEIPLDESHVPNHFIEATLVSNGRIHVESCQLRVPPVRDVVNLELHANKESYKPGSTGRVRIKATDAAGQPVSGEVALTAYDKSLTYIQPEYGQGPRSLLAKRVARYWSPGVRSPLGPRRFGASGEFLCPEFHHDDGSQPGIMAIFGAPPQGGDPSDRGWVDLDFAVANRAPTPRFWQPPRIRQNFSDTAIWRSHVVLDEQGTAEAELTFPDSLTTWRMRGYLVTKSTRVGDAVSEVTTQKKLLVRLQAPRFLVEQDEVVLSANVHNYLPIAKDVAVELVVPAEQFNLLNDASGSNIHDSYLHLVARALVDPDSEHRFDWRLKVLADGLATITVKALTDSESDALRLALPVRARGVLESQSLSGFVPASAVGKTSLNVELPTQIDPDETQLTLTLAPSAGGAVFDALPYLASYPYGCVEQTMSRFYPTVLATHTLKKMGTNIETIAANVRERRRKPNTHFQPNLVLDTAELQRMSEAGLQRLYRFQHADGGWGWWEHDESSPYMTAYVLLGLHTAANAQVEVRTAVYERGESYLVGILDALAGSAGRNSHHQRAFIAYVLSLDWSAEAKRQRGEIRDLVDNVYRERGGLNSYGQALLALALHNRQRPEWAANVLHDLLQGIQVDRRRTMAWLPTSKSNWWRWYNSDVETNAWVLRAIMAIDPSNELLPQIANWLAHKRQHGHYWKSTRDTALAVHALAEYLLKSRATAADFTVVVSLDDRQVSHLKVSLNDVLEMESQVVLDGSSVKPGPHRITLTKNDARPLFYTLHAQYLSRPEHIRATGNGISVKRRYYRPLSHTQLKSGDTVAVGETIEVELTISADQPYSYLAFEDHKPAGCEPIQLRSGYSWGDGLCSNVELRDAKVVFFVSQLQRGEHVLRYKLRAEVPGHFHALPATGFAMYAPQIRARSAEFLLHIRD